VFLSVFVKRYDVKIFPGARFNGSVLSVCVTGLLPDIPNPDLPIARNIFKTKKS